MQLKLHLTSQGYLTMRRDQQENFHSLSNVMETPEERMSFGDEFGELCRKLGLTRSTLLHC